MTVDSWFRETAATPLADLTRVSRQYLNPHKVDTFAAAGFAPVMTDREGPYFWDSAGRRVFDAHSNGGTYNLGHRNPEIVQALRDALDRVDMGNHHFLSGLRSRLAQELVESVPGEPHYAVLCATAADAVDVAIKSARRATGRRAVVSAVNSYHGSTLGSMAHGDVRNADFFSSGVAPAEGGQAPFGDLEALDVLVDALGPCAVLLETIPATAGFPMPPPGYLAGVRAICDRAGALLVLDEVQVGLGRTGLLWAVEHEGVAPDVLVTGKGLGGGVYPVAAAVLTRRAGGWLEENGWGHGSTGGGSELGCVVALKVLEILRRPETLANVTRTAQQLAAGLGGLAQRYPLLRGVRQRGLVMGLELDHPLGGRLMTQHGYAHGLWAMFAAYDPSVLQLKPGLTLDEAQTDELLRLVGSTLESVTKELGR